MANVNIRKAQILPIGDVDITFTVAENKFSLVEIGDTLRVRISWSIKIVY